MSNIRYPKIAYTYADTFYLSVATKKALPAIYKQVSEMVALNEKGEFILWKVLRSPIVKTSDALAILSAVFKKYPVDKDLQSFLAFVVRKQRGEYIIPILRAFIRIYRKAKNIISVQLTTANVLEKKQINAIVKMVEKKTKAKEILLSHKRNESLLGGMILKIENKVLDLSVKKQLERVIQQIF